MEQMNENPKGLLWGRKYCVPRGCVLLESLGDPYVPSGCPQADSNGHHHQMLHKMKYASFIS